MTSNNNNSLIKFDFLGSRAEVLAMELRDVLVPPGAPGVSAQLWGKLSRPNTLKGDFPTLFGDGESHK